MFSLVIFNFLSCSTDEINVDVRQEKNHIFTERVSYENLLLNVKDIRIKSNITSVRNTFNTMYGK
jgi:hypothetical protein